MIFNHRDRTSILNFELIHYEQGADWVRIEAYLKRWWQWVRTGVDGGYTVVEHLPCVMGYFLWLLTDLLVPAVV